MFQFKKLLKIKVVLIFSFLLQLPFLLFAQTTTPVIGVPVYYNGSPSNASNSGLPGFVAVTYSPGSGTSSLTNTVTTLANMSQIGATWGTAYDSRNNTFYTGAVQKRHVGFANSPGTIYKINAANSTPAASILIDLNGKTGTLPGGATSPVIDCGTAATDHGPLTDVSSPSRDNPSFALAGKSSLGDLDISATRNFLWVINAKQSQLISINISNPAAPTVDKVYPINSTSTGITPTDGQLRAWGIEISNSDDVYIGVVASAENVTPATPTTAGPIDLTSTTSRESIANRAKLQGYIFKLNKITGAFTQAASFPLNYARAYAGVGLVTTTPNWVPWYDDYTQGFPNTGTQYFQIYPQPLISDMDIMDDGSMLIAVMDRFGLQTGSEQNQKPTGLSGAENGRASGDVIRLLSSGSNTWSGTISNFYGDAMSVPENAAALGGIAYKSGTTEFIGGTVDAINATSNGLTVISVPSGNVNDNQDLISYSGTGLSLPANNLIASKGCAMGDVEIGFAGAPPAPITPSFAMSQTAATCSGTTDLNNGSISLNTLNNGDKVGFVIGATYSGGPNYASSSAILSLPFSVVSNIPNSGNTYTIRVFNGSDATYHDTTIIAALVSCGPPPPTGSVGNYVWNDNDNNGINNEPATAGINGVTVELWKETAPGSGTYTFNSTSTTANDGTGNPGYYLFTVSTSANYKVKFPVSLPSKALTSQTITAATDNNSDASTVDGFTPAFAINILGTGVSKDNLTLDAGYICNNGITTTNYTINAGQSVPGGQGLTYTGGATCTGTQSLIMQVPINIPTSPIDNGNTQVALGTATMPALPAGSTITSASIYIPGITAISPSWQADIRIDLTGAITLTGPIGTGAINGSGAFAYTTPIAPANINTAGGSINLFYREDFNDNNGGADATFTTGTPLAGAFININYSAPNTIGWYTASTGGIAIATGTIFNPIGVAGSGLANTNTAGTTTFYVGCSDGSCRTPATFTITPPLASLGNRVWLDEGSGGGIAKDGLQNGTEPGVSNVSVSLYQNGVDGLSGTSDDVLVAATITDAYGNYLFESLTPSSSASTQYNVRVTPPANYTLTTQTNTADDNLNTAPSTTGSDVNVLGVSYSVDLSAGENNLNIDAGLVFPSAPLLNALGDKVWFDLDGNGQQNGLEPGVAGITVTLYNTDEITIVSTTTTDANGNYLFNNLPSNTNYKIKFSAPGGTKLTSSTGTTASDATTNSDADATTGLTATINTGATGTIQLGIDAGLINDTKGALGDYVWNDVNNNGLQDAGEQGIPNVTMKLYGPGANNAIGGGDDVLLSTTTTDSKGYYIFPNLDPAKYFVVATPISGYTNSTANLGTDDTKDVDFIVGSAPYTASYVSGLYTLLSAAGGVTRDMTVDLGIHNNTGSLGSLGDMVWNDINKDGLQTAGEPGVPNVSVRLLNGSGVAVNNATTGLPYVQLTDSIGNYKFVDLAAGTYIVEFANLPTGYVFTSQDASGTGAPGSVTDGTNDNDAKSTNGRTASITLGAAQSITSVDAGITQGTPAGTASLGNRVWYDNGNDAIGALVPANNNNGLQDAGELGVVNVKVELLTAAGAAVNVPNTSIPYVVYTNALGEYLFTGLAAGDYTVRFSNIPSGFTSSAANIGTDDAIDADANFAGAAITASTTATTGIYTLQTGEDNLTVDMGIVPPTTGSNNSIGNFVWTDLNSDGIQDVGEPGVQGVTMSLFENGLDLLPNTSDDVLVAVTTTDNNGKYQFVGLPDGNYNIGFTNKPAGLNYTTKDASGSTVATGSDANNINGRTASIALDPTSVSSAAVNNPTVDAGLTTTRSALGNYVWLDINGDGVQDIVEKGISGVTVTLYASDGTTVLASTITDAFGKYYFGNLTPGSFVVGFSTVPSNLSYTIQNSPGDNGNNTNSDVDPLTGKTGLITLTSGETDLTIDAGLKPTYAASVGDYVWNDKNSNGVQNIGEPGVPGIIVTLYDASTNAVVGTAVTDGNGKYLIDKVPVAFFGTSYYIIFSNLTSGATFTTQTSDVSLTDVTLGSDANISTGKTANFTLLPGQYLPSVDAGIINVQLLPIKIESFTAMPKGSQVNLQWVVSNQIDVASYDVETSTDGRVFSKITTVQASASTSATYNTIHTTPVVGVNYYRIKSKEIDGTISYSEIRRVTFGKVGGAIITYPNPASKVVYVSLPEAMISKAATITVLSIDGKIFNQINIASTNQTELVDVSKLGSGTYILRININNKVINQTIQVLN